MILVFFIFVFILISLLVLISSTISIRIEKLNISNFNDKYKLTYNYEIYFELLFLNKIKMLSVKIDKEKVKRLNSKVNFKNRVQNMNFMKVKKDLPQKELKEIFKILNIEFSKIYLKVEVGTEDVIITSLIITILASILGIGLARVIKKYEKEKYNYEIYPVYQNRNLINLNLNCIIKVKMVHIISIIYILLKKRRVEKHERTSNRRAYDYSYE